ncbi:MAG: YfbK domain-containing protein, partial [Planctomycetota bacterium]
ENRVLAARDFRNDAVDAGEVGSGHEVVALYELEEAPRPEEGDPLVATVRLRWFPDGAGEAVEMERTLRWSRATGRWGLTQARFRLSAVAAQFAEVLRRSYWARGDSYDELQAQAGRLAGELPGDAQVRELRDFIARTRELVRKLGPDDELTGLVEEARRMQLQQARLEGEGRRSEEVEELLKEVRRQNAELEKKILELLGKQG